VTTRCSAPGPSPSVKESVLPWDIAGLLSPQEPE
jgi:hypothetical protein